MNETDGLVDKFVADNTGFPCEAYSAEGDAVGARCFFSPAEGTRECDSAAQCHLVMTGARIELWNALCRRAGKGDETARYVLTAAGGYQQLLGGGPAGLAPPKKDQGQSAVGLEPGDSGPPLA